MSGGSRSTGERGIGLFGSMVGVVIMLSTVLLATHILLILQRRSVVNAVAFDVARSVAREGGITQSQAEDRGRQLLNDDAATFEWIAGGGDAIALRVTTHGPQLIAIGPLAKLSLVVRTVHVRRERFRSA